MTVIQIPYSSPDIPASIPDIDNVIKVCLASGQIRILLGKCWCFYNVIIIPSQLLFHTFQNETSEAFLGRTKICHTVTPCALDYAMVGNDFKGGTAKRTMKLCRVRGIKENFP